MAKGPTKSMWLRMMIVMLALVVGTMGVSAFRLGKLMLADAEFYQNKASEQQLYDTELSPTRGDIYDAKMNVLATSATVWTVYITPKNIKNAEQKNLIADGFSEILSLDRDKVYAMTEKSNGYVIVKKKVEKPEADKVRAYISDNKLGSMAGLDESSKRYYPNDSLASTVLGFVGDDNQGLAGVEAYYETQLKGVPGRMVAAKNARGANMPFSYEKMVDATPGSSLVLTIDSYVQHVAEKYLEQAVRDNNVSNRGACIVMNVNTGEVLAMAVKDDFNPNSPFTLSEADQQKLEGLEGEERTSKLSELRNKQWRNKAVSDPYEPGSVFKVVTGAAAIEEHVTDTSKRYNCPGYIVVAGQRYNCHKTTGHGAEGLAQAFQNSCNPVFITFGQLMGTSTFSRYFDAFGLTKKTGIDLPGEATSMYHAEAKMGPVELASTSFGQTFTITPIQLITAVSAAVNGGYLVQPHVVSRILDGEGNVTKSVETVRKRQVVSSETSKLVCEMLESVVSEGGGGNAYVPGYRVGGKTGTSQKIADELQGSGERLRISSFCGIAPMDNPQVAVLVMLDEPHADNVYGGTIAAPVGGQVLGDILPYMGIEPQYSEEELKTMAIKPPNVVGKSKGEAKNEIQAAGLQVKLVGGGDKIERQVPASSQSIAKNGVVVLYTEGAGENSMVTVPNLTGMAVAGVNSTAASANLNVAFSGGSLTSGQAVSYRQSVEEGQQVEAGTTITVYFRAEDNVE
ncbi:MAG: PASTA domain-containing protein [Clostridiales bacterium]|nr:PASTA domain-containing protein [Clostridiales bacterium]